MLARQNRWAFPFWLQCVSVVCLGSMSLVCLILRRPSFYEVSIAGGYCFVMAGFLALGRALFGGGIERKWLLLAGLLLGLAVGCRPHLVVICGIVLVSFAIRVRGSLRRAFPLAALMAVSGILLGWYNYVRFDNPLEFGMTYQLTSVSHSVLQRNVKTTFRSAYKFLFVAPHVDATLPFVHTVFIDPLSGWSGPAIWTEDTVGLIPAAPFALLGFFAPLLLRKRLIVKGVPDEASAWLLDTMYWSGLVVFVVLCVVGWVHGRYLVDFASLLTFEGASMVVMWWQILRERPGKYVFEWEASTVAIYGAALNAALAIPRLDLIFQFLRR